jgi:hypothetical protein
MVKKTNTKKKATTAIAKKATTDIAKKATTSAAKKVGAGLLKKLPYVGLAVTALPAVHADLNKRAREISKQVEQKKATTEKSTPKPAPKKPAPKKAATPKATTENVVKKMIDRSREIPDKAPVKQKSWDDYRVSQTPKDAPKMNGTPKATTEKSTPKATSTAPTVSQMWKEKTGMPWSKAKELGLTDGSYGKNIALMKKLKSGSLTNADLLPENKKTEVSELKTKKEEIPREIEQQKMRKGGIVQRKKMRKGEMKGKKMKMKEGEIPVFMKKKKPKMKMGGKKY